MQQQKVLRNKVFIHWPTIILKSSLSVMGNTCLEIKLDIKRRQIQTTLSDRTRFKVEQYEDNSFSFYSYVKKKYVGIKGTSLAWKDNVDDTCRFELERTEGNNPFPEADVNIDFYDEDGNPITTSNVMARPSSGENIIGTADTHVHLCHNKGSGEVVFNGDAFSPLGIADALNDCTDLHGVNGAYDIWGKAVDGATTHNTSGYVTNALPPYKNGVTNDMDVIRQNIGIRYGL